MRLLEKARVIAIATPQRAVHPGPVAAAA
jgi:hypothetical protein